MNVRKGVLAFLIGWLIIASLIFMVVLYPASVVMLLGSVVALLLGVIVLEIAKGRGWVEL